MNEKLLLSFLYYHNGSRSGCTTCNIMWEESNGSVQKQVQHSPFLPTAKQTSHPPLTYGFPGSPQMFYLPPQPWTLLLLHVCLQLNEKKLLLPLPPPSSCVSKEIR
ncbi:hypothetical protein CHARACLAT_029704 [Characodon lateralis]|uniref:Uncharacterized protein n=1 Tax=Characodon lateralis TaxID=208331 RepID=A0ABU7EXV5_9TELE|nr:hypothetical protein [Characodon lateralis]